jgi:FkbM family methyltransferase
MIKKVLVQCWLYVNYPNKLRSDIVKLITNPQARKLGIQTYPPDYVYLDRFNEDSRVIDIGCGFKAEFSCHLIDRYHLKSFGVDPTKKHKPLLRKIVEKYNGHFQHVEVAVSKNNAALTFYETQENESGSLLTDHQNIIRDTIVSYQVRSMNIRSLISELGLSHVALLKIDIEGAEYELLESITPEMFQHVDQLFVEFHHHAIKKYTRKDTRRIIGNIKKMGYESYTRDGNNYLFYLPELISKQI